jgi:hypothetical protein
VREERQGELMHDKSGLGKAVGGSQPDSRRRQWRYMERSAIELGAAMLIS